MCYNGHTTRTELKQILFPPWIGYGFGTIEVVLVLPFAEREATAFPQMAATMQEFTLDAMDLDQIKLGLSGSAREKAKCEMKASICTNAQTARTRARKTFTPEEQERMNAAGDAAAVDVFGKSLCFPFRANDYPDWHRLGALKARVVAQPTSSGAKAAWNAAKRKRREDMEVADRSKKARADLALARSLRPNGSEFKRAAAEWDAMVAASEKASAADDK